MEKLEILGVKAELFAYGMGVSEKARNSMLQRDGMRPPTLADFASTSGITLNVNDEFYVNVPIATHNPALVINPKYVLDYIDDEYILFNNRQTLKVNPLPIAEYDAHNNADGVPYSDFGITHVDRVRISPISGCALDCHFCDFTSRNNYYKSKIESFIEAIGKAIIDPILPAQHILISGGTPYKDDYKYLNNVISEVCGNFPDIPVDVMAIPDKSMLNFAELYELGVNQLSLNIEIFDWQIAKQLMPEKAKMIMDTRFDSLKYGVEIFGKGNVRSILIVGLETIDSTLQGIEELLRIGVQPVLSPFRPDPRSCLKDHPSPSAEFMVEACVSATKLAERYGMTIGPDCKMCQHNVISMG